MEHNQGVTPSGPGHSPSGLSPVARSQAEPSVPNASRALWFIADCIGNVVVVLGLPVAMGIDLIANLTGRMRT